jgi:hypothetical protein
MLQAMAWADQTLSVSRAKNQQMNYRGKPDVYNVGKTRLGSARLRRLSAFLAGLERVFHPLHYRIELAPLGGGICDGQDVHNATCAGEHHLLIINLVSPVATEDEPRAATRHSLDLASYQRRSPNVEFVEVNRSISVLRFWRPSRPKSE